MIQISSLHLAYGSRTIFDNEDFLVRPTDRIGLVGPNGAGKTSLFRIITGQEKADAGTISIDPGTVIGYFSQDVGEMQGGSALEEVLSGAGTLWSISQTLAELEHRMADPDGQGLSNAEMEQYGELQNEFLHHDGYNLENRAATILTGLGIGPDRYHEPVQYFSGGWKMRIALAKILVLNPDLLLMDEPTNHLDVESIVWLEEWLRSFTGDLVMISHDREFMTRLCTRTVEVSAGKISTFSGDYDFYLREREIRREQLLATFKRQQATFAKDEEFIARFAARASHAAQVQSRVKMLDKIERVELPLDPKSLKLQFARCQRSGDQVLVFDKLTKSWPRADGGVQPVFSGLSGIVSRGNRIAVTGINGAGKSTLLSLIYGLTTADSGTCRLGASLYTGYFSQYSSDILRPGFSIFDELAERLPQASSGSIKNLLGAFQFSGDDVDKKISVLSGGEKSRVMLACVLAVPVNFLILDEPTNHLDIQSREVLLEALQEFDGTIMLVSHDRYFLRHLVNRVFEIDHGSLHVYEGDYQYYLEKSGQH
ncbi:MAG: ATP-binding cassette domain-containing protein [Spirochaetes bacterium]|nr:ATP-binding cassette domain-containing protein [Spirochaetota bacterium]MBU0956147.1 ATP-binding cassette domain-containing protein [Spirochaetota bacterium]